MTLRVAGFDSASGSIPVNRKHWIQDIPTELKIYYIPIAYLLIFRFEEVKRARAARKGSRRARAVRMALAGPHLVRLRVRVRLRARPHLIGLRWIGLPSPLTYLTYYLRTYLRTYPPLLLLPLPLPLTEGGGHEHERSS